MSVDSHAEKNLEQNKSTEVTMPLWQIGQAGFLDIVYVNWSMEARSGEKEKKDFKPKLTIPTLFGHHLTFMVG